MNLEPYPLPKRSSRAHAVAAALLAAAFAAPALAQPQAGPASGIDRRHADLSVRAQDDFFRHANGTWLKTTPIPADRSRYGAFTVLDDQARAQLRAIIEQSASAAGSDANARLIGALYTSFMDEAAIERAGLQPLRAELARIDAVADVKALTTLFARFTRQGVPSPFGLWIAVDDKDSTRHVPRLWQSGLGLPDRDYYLKLDDEKFKTTRDAYVAHLGRLFALAGLPDGAAAAPRILALETELARVQWPRVDNRDPVKRYNRFDVGALPTLLPQVDWPAWLAELGVAGRTPDVLVSQPSYMQALGPLFERTPLADWKAYARARLLSEWAPYLGKAFVDEHFAFNGTVLQGTPKNRERWERGVELVEQSAGEALGQLYVARHFPPANKARMETLVANLMAAYRQSIDGLAWMGPDTKREAQAKLAAMGLKIGYPKKWIDYAALVARPDDLVGNVARAREFEHRRDVAKLGRPVDRDEWGMTPQTVNAYYSPPLNEIVFPAGILQPPFFDVAADDAVNYGAIGAVIGHEISHGFDDSGSRYDARGILRDWWTAEDRKRFEERTQVLVDQYSRFEPVAGYKLNGRQTLGENIADNSGLAVAYKAWKLSLGGKPAPVIDGMTGDQRFFYGWAQVWRDQWREARLIQQIKSGAHSPGEFRANGTVRNQSGFHEAFGTKPGDPMYLPPAERASIW